MTPEALAFAAARLLESGALDVYTVAGTMKKGRPGWELTVLCGEEQIDETARNIMRETTTNGVRPEYEDTAAFARKSQVSYGEAYEQILSLRREQIRERESEEDMTGDMGNKTEQGGYLR